MPNVPYSYEVNGKLVTGNCSLIPISSLTKRSLLPSMTVQPKNDKDSVLLIWHTRVCIRIVVAKQLTESTTY